ncbi:sensor histidine kinase [Amycolatopsis sp. CA-230715]|uniref:sensor histidine kinase n=1 Tax=Amycolatopsis sp. CA-230715 TaxID=2745196 RepID=UPI0020B39E2D|nr:sensor histidine kinase [Amycolatopsis sp. CA-230715]
MTTSARAHRHWSVAALEWVRWAMLTFPLFSVFPVREGWVWPLLAVAALAALPVLWTDRIPAGGTSALLLVLVASNGALWLLAPGNWCLIGMFTAVFFLVRGQSRIVVAAGIALGSACVVLKAFRAHGDLTDSLLTLAVLASVVLLGYNRRARLERVEQTELALARAQQANEEHAVAAALQERARIARELHDVLAHSLSGLALNLQGARLMLVRDGASAEAVKQVERAQRLAAEGLVEARKAVAALRDAPMPLERALDDLVAGYRLDSGAAAELVVDGDAANLDAGAHATITRTVQEALSNTRKHAPGAPVVVTLTRREDRVELEVRDRQGEQPTDPSPGGFGLRGMRERAALLGGELDSGPVEDGWRVHLVVPAKRSG